MDEQTKSLIFLFFGSLALQVEKTFILCKFHVEGVTVPVNQGCQFVFFDAVVLLLLSVFPLDLVFFHFI